MDPAYKLLYITRPVPTCSALPPLSPPREPPNAGRRRQPKTVPADVLPHIPTHAGQKICLRHLSPSGCRGQCHFLHHVPNAIHPKVADFLQRQWPVTKRDPRGAASAQA